MAGALGSHFPPGVWMNFTFGGICLAFYYLGLTQGYQSGDFSVVYPLARSLPVFTRHSEQRRLMYCHISSVNSGCAFTAS